MNRLACDFACEGEALLWLHLGKIAASLCAQSLQTAGTSGEAAGQAEPGSDDRRRADSQTNECLSESDRGRGDERSTQPQTPCWPPLGCLHPREYATRTLAVCHWSNHTAVLNKPGRYRCQARAAIKRRRQSDLSNAPDNAVYHTHSLRDCYKRERKETGHRCHHAAFTLRQRACASHKWHFVTSKSPRRSRMAANAYSGRGSALHSFQLYCAIQSR